VTPANVSGYCEGLTDAGDTRAGIVTKASSTQAGNASDLKGRISIGHYEWQRFDLGYFRNGRVAAVPPAPTFP
jgi:hypothetical protein